MPSGTGNARHARLNFHLDASRIGNAVAGVSSRAGPLLKPAQGRSSSHVHAINAPWSSFPSPLFRGDGDDVESAARHKHAGRDPDKFDTLDGGSASSSDTNGRKSVHVVFGMPFAIVVAAACCFLASCALTVATYIVTREMANTREEVRPLISAAVPIMSESGAFTSAMRQASEDVLQITEMAYNATQTIVPISQLIYHAVNDTSTTLQHMEHMAHHPVLHIDMGEH